MGKPVSIVFTTIYLPKVVDELYRNINQFGHLDEVKLWIVGDLRTPRDVGELAKRTTKKGLETAYLDVALQDQWGKRFPSFYRRIPYNNETRRNIGYLCALEDGCDILISIDDDNFPNQDDFVGNHLRTGQTWAGKVLSEISGFHNICEHIIFEPTRAVYPRGFPFDLRNTRNKPELRERAEKVNDARIGVTAGMWLSDPDIDATTWLNGELKGIEYCGDACVMLDQSTWMPINTQNTSVARDLIPAFFCIPMGWDMPGGRIQRYGDVWGGYFLQSIIRGTDYYVSFGRPLVNHLRNPHNYLDDLRYEYWGMVFTDWILKLLREDFSPSGNAVVDRVTELATYIHETAISKLPTWSPKEMAGFLKWTSGNLLEWVKVCRVLGG